MHTPDKQHSHAHGHSHMGVMVLCVALMAGAFLYFSGANLETGLSLGLLVPLLVCVGAHFLMHRFMGHGDGHAAHTENDKAQKGPLGSLPEKCSRRHVSIQNTD